jgi:hypothetical protein
VKQPVSMVGRVMNLSGMFRGVRIFNGDLSQ